MIDLALHPTWVAKVKGLRLSTIATQAAVGLVDAAQSVFVAIFHLSDCANRSAGIRPCLFRFSLGGDADPAFRAFDLAIRLQTPRQPGCLGCRDPDRFADLRHPGFGVRLGGCEKLTTTLATGRSFGALPSPLRSASFALGCGACAAVKRRQRPPKTLGLLVDLSETCFQLVGYLLYRI
jgi:hypothetical protein